MRYLVDGMNVIGSRPDGWWRNRPAARQRLVVELRHLAGQGHDVSVVFDGRPTPDEQLPRSVTRPGDAQPGDPHSADAVPGDAVSVRFAPGGRDAADHVIAAMAAGDAEPGSLTVVTSDAALADRVRATGAAVTGAAAFRQLLDAAGPGTDRHPGPSRPGRRSSNGGGGLP